MGTSAACWRRFCARRRDRDGIFGFDFTRHVKNLGINEVLWALRSPWQRAYVERAIGTIRRECLDHLIVFSDSLRRTLSSYFDYYHGARTHLSLRKDAPVPRPVQPTSRDASLPSSGGRAASPVRAPRRLTSHRLSRMLTSLLNLIAFSQSSPISSR